MNIRSAAFGAAVLLLTGCADARTELPSGTLEVSVARSIEVPADDPALLARPDLYWNSATIYFLLTDRFHNGDPTNDTALGRAKDGAVLRSFEGGDLVGLRERIEDGYFEALGVDAIWLTPFVEQISGPVDEGTGRTYGFHGYWARDWTRVDPALGSEGDLAAVVRAAHERGIRVLMDAVIQHPGPVTEQDPAWPDDWVRGTPNCAWEGYESTVSCNLVPTLPDFITERNEPVELPAFLREKWEAEGRLSVELRELDEWFQRTGYPRAPHYYVMKWLTDWVRELGFDGYRVDTAKHFEESISAELAAEASRAFQEWKEANPDEVLDDLPFWMMGEVYNYEALNHGRDFDFGDRTVDYYAHGYDALINFDFKWRAAQQPLGELYGAYAETLRSGALQGKGVVHYVSSHDDGSPFDRGRELPLEAGTRLLLAPGAVQIYYGDEVARPLQVPGAQGDANLRSPLDWRSAESGEGGAVLEHWRRLGRFRAAHPAVGAGAHVTHQADPLIFSRTLELEGFTDRVLVALGLGAGAKSIPVFGVFPDGTTLTDAYSGTSGVVTGGAVTLETPGGPVLLAEGS